MQKVEGNVHVSYGDVHRLSATRAWQLLPGPGSDEVLLPAERLRSVLGITEVRYVARKHSLAVVDSTLPNAADAETARRLTDPVKWHGKKVVRAANTGNAGVFHDPPPGGGGSPVQFHVAKRSTSSRSGAGWRMPFAGS